MKKIVSIILLFSMLISMLTLTSCDKEEMALGLIQIIVDILFPPEPDTPPHTHTPSPIQAVESTCTEHGLTEGSYCLTCGEVLIPQREAPLKQHVYDSDSDAICNLCYYERYCVHHNISKLTGKSATCTETGLSEGEVCLDCGATIVEQQVIPLNAHTEGTLPAVESTCTTYGKTEGKYCTTCEKILVPQEAAPLKNHTYSADNDMTCNVCSYERGCTHKNVEVLSAKAATCTTTGLTEGIRCKDCGEIIVSQQILDLKDHTEEKINAVAATCTKTGLTEGKKCSVCSKIIVAQQTVDVLPHTQSDWIIDTAATETTEGLKHIECTVCKQILMQSIITENVVYTLETKTGYISNYTSGVRPGIKYTAVIEYRNRTENSVEIRINWTTLIEQGRTCYGQRFKFSVASASSGDVVLSYYKSGTGYSSGTKFNKVSGWVKVDLTTAQETTIDLKVYYWQTNSNNVDMTNNSEDSTKCLNTTWRISIPAN